MAPVRLAEVAIQESLVSDHALAMCSWKSIDFHRSIEAIWTSSAKHLAPVFSILQGATPLGHQLNWLDQSVCLEFRFGDIQPAKVRMFSIRVRHILQVHSKWSFGCSRVTKETAWHPKKQKDSGVIYVPSMTNMLHFVRSEKTCCKPDGPPIPSQKTCSFHHWGHRLAQTTPRSTSGCLIVQSYQSFTFI